MRAMSAGDGYEYLLRTVATGDGERTLSTPLTRYYAEEGTPPGRWIGSAVTVLGGRALAVGDEVTEEQLQLLIAALLVRLLDAGGAGLLREGRTGRKERAGQDD